MTFITIFGVFAFITFYINKKCYLGIKRVFNENIYYICIR